MWRGTWPHKAERQTDGVQDGVAWALRGKVEAPCSPYLWSSLSPRATAHTQTTLPLPFSKCRDPPYLDSAFLLPNPEQTPTDVCDLPSWDQCCSCPAGGTRTDPKGCVCPSLMGPVPFPAQQRGTKQIPMDVCAFPSWDRFRSCPAGGASWR